MTIKEAEERIPEGTLLRIDVSVSQRADCTPEPETPLLEEKSLEARLPPIRVKLRLPVVAALTRTEELRKETPSLKVRDSVWVPICRITPEEAERTLLFPLPLAVFERRELRETHRVEAACEECNRVC